MRSPLRIWFLAPEVTPFAKTGGLADVTGSLPPVLKDRGVDVMIGLPFYRVVKEGGCPAEEILTGLEIPARNGVFRSRVFESRTREGIPVYLFEVADLFDRPYLYGTPEGDYPDNLERFACFCRAALMFAESVGLPVDVVHCHDWQTGLIPVYLRTLYRDTPLFSGVSSVFTVHNLGYQGLFPEETGAAIGIPDSEFHSSGLEYWGQMSLLKGGLTCADIISTVSPRYSEEIQTPELGLGLDGVLRERASDLYGILNGVDYRVWNPFSDPHIPAHYDLSDMTGKGRCKAGLLEEMGFDGALSGRPLIAMVSRLAAQKGCDLLVQAAEDILALNVGLVILGAGDETYESLLQALGEKHPQRVAVRIGFDDPLAHRIMAGADMLLVPSRYEPCGLTQMYGLKYGTVPIVRATGGLDGTIEQFDEDTDAGTGFKFSEYEPGALLDQVKKAVQVFEDPSRWSKIVEKGMKADFSWEKSAREYALLYEKAAEKARRERGLQGG